MSVCLVLGMGIPTIPNYIITSSLAAPRCSSLGVPLIVSHMFVFYFGIMADLTPPVALAAFAAAPIARVSGMKIGVQAVRIALAGFIIPYMAVYTPALMLQGGTWFDTGYVVVKAIVAILLWGGAAIGYWAAPLNWIERVWAFVAAAFLVAALPMTDEIGLGLGVALAVWHYPANAGTPTRAGRNAEHGRMTALALCIVVGTALHIVPAHSFTLRWQHTVEKVVWEEDYIVAGDWLYLVAARVRGSGAGMEPPAGAVRIGDAWQYRPTQRWHRELKLARSEFGRDYELCVGDDCRPLSAWAPAPLAPTTLSACTAERGLR